MAIDRSTATLHFLVCVLVISYTSQPVYCIQEFLGDCGYSIDMVMTPSLNSGIFTMPMPDSMDKYQNPAQQQYCDMIITFSNGMNLQIELYFLDIMPRSSDVTTCTTGLEIFDQTGRKYYGGRICMEAWQWEERHREKRQEKVVVQNSPLTFRLISEGPYRGQGFKLHFNQFRPTYPCYTREFKCQQIQRCVNDDLTCDSWDDCGDYSDERWEAGCGLLTASEICSLIMGVVLLIGTVAQIVIFCISYRRLAQMYGMKSVSKIPIADEKYNMDGSLGVPWRYNSQDSIPSRHSRSTAATMARRDSGSDIVDKADLEKTYRQELLPLTGSRGDNGSERSYRSNPRRNMTQPLGSEVPSEPVKKSGQYSYNSRKGRSSSQSSLTRDRSEPRNGQDVSVDNDSMDKERLGSRERLSEKKRRSSRHRRDNDSDDYDDSRERYDDDEDRDSYDDRRRRSSRDRYTRRSDRYSDDDSDDDRDRRGRRRRRRSYDSYSDDSDYEYERKSERKRSRNRYNDKYEDDSGDDRGRGRDEDRRRQSSRKVSRERKHDDEQYSREKYDDDTDRSNTQDEDKVRTRDHKDRRDRDYKDKRDSDRERYRNSYGEERGHSRHQNEDDEPDRSSRHRRSEEKRQGLDNSHQSRSDRKRSRSREFLQPVDKGRQSPSLPMPPPYTEQDPIQTALRDRNQQSIEKHNLPLPAEEIAKKTEQYPSSQNLKQAEQYPSSQSLKQAEQQNRSIALVEYRQKQPHISKPATSAADMNQEPQHEKAPPTKINEADRRKSTDDRRERYSRNRWTPKKNHDSPPPEYEDVAPKSTFVGISYREESV